MEILLVCGGGRKIQKTARFLKKRHIRKVTPKNILIYSVERKYKIADNIRNIIQSKIILYPATSLENKLSELLDNLKKDNKKQMFIFVASFVEIKKILISIKSEKYFFDKSCFKIKEGSIILVDKGRKIVKRIFT
jgi:hypothetical protein